MKPTFLQKPKRTDSYDLITSKYLYKDLEKELKKAKRKFLMQSMYLRPGRSSNELIFLIQQAKKRIPVVRLTLDWFTLADVPWLGFIPSNYRKGLKKIIEAVKYLKVNLVIVSKPKSWQRLFYYTGRNHIKLVIIDDTSYLGGINLSDPDYGYLDFMLKIKDPIISKILSKIFYKSTSNLLRNSSYVVNKNTIIMTDGGERNKSEIYEFTKSELKKTKKSIVFVNQFPPTGEILEILSQQHKKNVEIKILIPKINKFNKVFALIHLLLLFKLKIKYSFLKLNLSNNMIHAKLIIFDNKSIITGSHNFNQLGVLAGTKELALFTTNNQLVKKAKSYADSISKI